MNQLFSRIVIAAAVPLLILAAGCKGASQENRQQRPGRVEAVEVQFAPVEAITVERTIPMEGTLLAVEEARISCEVSGFVESAEADLGNLVRQGQVLVSINPKEFQLNVDRAEASLRQTEAQLGGATGPDADDNSRTLVRQAKANLDDAATNLAQVEQLRHQGLISQQELNSAQTKYKVMEALHQGALEGIQGLRATLQERRAALELAKKKLADTRIRASIAGMVKEKLVSKGDYLRENTPVMIVVRMDPLRLRLALSEKYASQVRLAMPVRFAVEAYADELFTGKITNLSPSVDPQTRTFTVEAVVSNSSLKLKPGFFVKGWVVTDPTATALAVPQEAVVSFAGVKKVFLLDGKKAKESLVQTGVVQGRLMEILTGVKTGDKVAVTSLSRLADGILVHENATDSP